MKRVNKYLLYVAVAGFIVASALPGCVREEMSDAGSDAAERKYDDYVLFGASCATRAGESSTFGKQVGDTLPLSNNIFDVQNTSVNDKGELTDISGFPFCGPVPFFIQQFWKEKDSEEWYEEIGMYTDWSNVIGQLAFYNDTEYTYANHTKDTYSSSYPYFIKPKKLKWHADREDVQHIFNAWTADFEMQHTNHTSTGHSTRWVTMDKLSSGARSSQYGTVRFFHFLRNANNPRLLRGASDSLSIGTTDWWGSDDHYRPSLEHFVGLTAMIGSKNNEKNPPITYQSNAQHGGGTNVSLLFQHLVCQLHVGKIRITKIDGGSDEFDNDNGRFVMFFPKLRRYARFTTGNPETGEGPHVIVDKEEEEKHIALMQELYGSYETLLNSTFSDQDPVEDRAGNVVYPHGEYDAYTRDGGLGLAASPFSYMYLAPFDLLADGEFEIWLMKKKIEDGDWPEIDKRYYGNLADLAPLLEPARKEKNHPAAPEGKETWLLPGEKLYFNLNLSDGRATGLHVTIEGWGEHGGSSGTGHGNDGIYADTEQGESSLFEDLRDFMGNDRSKLPDLYGDDQRLEFHDPVLTDHNSATTLHVPKDYTLDGLGNVLYIYSDNKNHWRRSGDQRDGKGGTICNLFVVMTDTKDISEADEKGYDFAYFNSKGELIGKDADNEGRDGPFTTMEELIDYLNENDCW